MRITRKTAAPHRPNAINECRSHGCLIIISPPPKRATVLRLAAPSLMSPARKHGSIRLRVLHFFFFLLTVIMLIRGFLSAFERYDIELGHELRMQRLRPERFLGRLYTFSPRRSLFHDFSPPPQQHSARVLALAHNFR